MKSFRYLAAVTLVTTGLAGSAQAQLLGVVQATADTKATTKATSKPYLVYDHNGVDANTGLLRLVSGASTLTEPGSAGGSSATQTYLGAGDSIPDVLLSIQVHNGAGGFAAGSFVSGLVSIGYGNSTTTNRWQWNGTITALGSQSGTGGTILDARWNVTADQYQNMPSNMSQFINGYLSGGTGGITIRSSAAWGNLSAGNFTNDWVYGPDPSENNNMASYRQGMTKPIIQTNSSITADIFASPVPEPATGWLLLIGLAPIALIVQAQKSKKAGLGESQRRIGRHFAAFAA
jgi:hypothetical protein